jgi:hypothetical protein
VLSKLVITSTTAFADSIDSGVYINLNAGVGGQLSSENISGGLASSINVGYNFNHYLAMDVGFNSIGGLGLSGISGSKIYALSAKGSLPLGEVFYLYGRLGLGYENFSYTSYTNIWNNTKEYNTTVTLIAAGASFQLGKHFELHLEDSFFSPLNSQPPATTSNMLQLGVQYNF